MKPEIVALSVLHYGKDYLEYAIRSVIDQVDRHFFFYSQTPSFGHRTSVKCPDTETELRSIAEEFSGDKCVWVSGCWTNEVEHRNAINCSIEKQSQIVVVDTDEVWDQKALEQALEATRSIQRRYFKVSPFYHFYRSFRWICTDVHRPIRIIQNQYEGDSDLNLVGPIYHFGYARSVRDTDFKWAIHGHLTELRPEWFQEKFVKWEPGMGDVHPTAVNFWNPKPFDPNQLPEFMRKHPYWELEIIP